jgi:acylphosphatase
VTAEDRIARRAYVSGRVQGVNFRAATARQAQRLGVTGHARNLADGRVEVFAVGPPAAVRELCEWLHRGPPLAEVRAVEESCVAPEEGAGLAGFRSL